MISDDVIQSIQNLSDSGMSQGLISKQYGVSQSTICRVLQGKDIKLSTAKKLEAAFLRKAVSNDTPTADYKCTAA